MSWIAKIFRRSQSPSGEQVTEQSEVVADRKRLLAKHIKIQIDKAKSQSEIVPREFVRHCQQLFADHIDDIAQKVVDAEVQGSPQNHSYEDPRSGVYMVVSVLPWTAEEAIRKLSEISPEKPFGYVAMMTNIFLNNWPSPDLTHFFHVLLCLGGNVFQMHTAAGHYGGFPKARRDFMVLPVELLNDHERRMTGL